LLKDWLEQKEGLCPELKMNQHNTCWRYKYWQKQLRRLKDFHSKAEPEFSID
jgi:hypothetical protein